MTPPLTTDHERALFEVMIARRTNRNIGPGPIPREKLERLLAGGFAAPYPVLGTRAADRFRRVFVLARGGEARAICDAAIDSHSRRLARVLRLAPVPFLVRLLDSAVTLTWRGPRGYREAADLLDQHPDNSGHFLHRPEAPFYVVLAERSRGPLLAAHLIRQSLGHWMQNIWLLATANDLAFQPLSLTRVLASNRAACRALGIARNEWEMDGFLIGEPTRPPPKKAHPHSVEEDVAWL